MKNCCNDFFMAIYIARSVIFTEFIDYVEHAMVDAKPYVEKFKNKIHLLSSSSSSPQEIIKEMSLDNELEVSNEWIKGNDTYSVLANLSLEALNETAVCVLLFDDGLVMCVGGNEENQVYFTIEARSGFTNMIKEETPDNALMYENQNFKAMYLKKKKRIKNKFKFGKHERINKKRKIK